MGFVVPAFDSHSYFHFNVYTHFVCCVLSKVISIIFLIVCKLCFSSSSSFFEQIFEYVETEMKGSRRCSRNNSNTSAASTRSNRSGSTAHSLTNKLNHGDGKYRVPSTLLETKSTYNSSIETNGDANYVDQPATNVTLPISSSVHSTTSGMVNI